MVIIDVIISFIVLLQVVWWLYWKITRISKPMGLQTSDITHDTLTLEWKQPEAGGRNVRSYTVLCRSENDPVDKWKSKLITSERNAKVDRLEPRTTYFFKVRPENGDRHGEESDITDPIKTKPYLSERIKQRSKRISEDGVSPEVYELPIEYAGGRRYVICEPSSDQKDKNEKVLMLTGATGSGKTALLNGIVNYILGVHLEDNFRFKLEHTNDANEAHSQTDKVTAYTFYPMDGSRVPYVLTIIDTPGFGDTRTIVHDRNTLAKILEFFSIGGQHGIDHFNGVGVVIQSSSARLTDAQKYIFDSILSVFAKDVSTNMFLMVTFADGQPPPALSAVNEANIPFGSLFKFNNSAIFANPETDVLVKGFWELGMQSFSNFFNEFESIKPVSIEKSKCVLEDRQQLNTIMKELQKQIAEGLENFNELDSERRLLEHYKSEMEMNKNFKYNVTTSKSKRRNLPSGQKALNCQHCFTSCNYPCELESDKEVYDCIVMNSHDPSVACCTICPSQCAWERHMLQRFLYENVKETIQKTVKKQKEQFDKAQNNHEESKAKINELEEHISQAKKKVLIKIGQARECKQRLNELAMKPGVVTIVEYIDILIQTETTEKKDDYLKRTEALNELKRVAKIVEDLDGGDDHIFLMMNLL